MNWAYIVGFGNINQFYPRPLEEDQLFDIAFSYIGPGSAATLLEISDQSLGYLVVPFLACERRRDRIHLVGFGGTKGNGYQNV